MPLVAVLNGGNDKKPERVFGRLRCVRILSFVRESGQTFVCFQTVGKVSLTRLAKHPLVVRIQETAPGSNGRGTGAGEKVKKAWNGVAFTSFAMSKAGPVRCIPQPGLRAIEYMEDSLEKGSRQIRALLADEAACEANGMRY